MCSAMTFFFFFFSSRRRHTRLQGDWSSDVCSSDLGSAWRRRANGPARSPPARNAAPASAGPAPRGGRPTPGRGPGRPSPPDRESGGEGKRVGLGGRRIIKKKKKVELRKRLTISERR